MQLTKALSNEWAADGVQVNAIAPGYFKTRMNAAYFEPAQSELYRGITQRIPAAR
jgi:2-deoxy-D-gluconate 3-dehydrogenase